MSTWRLILDSDLGLCRCRSFTPHLLHELLHGCNMTGSAALRPFLETLSGLLQICEHVRILKLLTELRHDRLQPFPHTNELAAGLEEKIFVQQAIVTHRSG